MVFKGAKETNSHNQNVVQDLEFSIIVFLDV
jgi:hypothetical protein